MAISFHAKRHNNKTQETQNTTTKNNTNTRNSKQMAIPRTSMAALLLAYLSPYPVSSSNRNKNIRNRDRNNVNDPMVLMSPQVGCLGQIKTRNHTSHGVRKRKQKTESNILVRCLAPLFKGSSRVQDVPRSTNMLVNVNITEIDPPLPVRMTKQEDLCKVSLWERRAGVRELGKLQLKEKRRQMTTLADILFSSKEIEKMRN